MEFEVIIGLEIHAQLLTEGKLFCSCATGFGAEPNTHTCPICLGMPGVLPVLNWKALEYALKTALATNCQISSQSHFSRKNYFYPDLPKGYQISQYEFPIAEEGYIEIEIDGDRKKIGITRIHLEEDAGKLIHQPDAHHSLVDFNRTGIPLLEIVTKPDIRRPEEASEFLKMLREILQYLEVCDGNMEEGNLRCDANISLRPKGREELGTKVEVKNMNSFRFIKLALEYEIKRQRELLEEGGEILQETRLLDVGRGITLPMRGKEEAHDYRYFPEPDLVPLRIEEGWLADIRRSLPELPSEKMDRFQRQYQIPPYDAKILTASKSLADYFEECVKLYPHPKTVSNWIMGELLRELKEGEEEVTEIPLTPGHLAEMLQLIERGVISGKIAKAIFEEMFKTGKRAPEIIKEKDLTQVSDQKELIEAIEKVLSANQDKLSLYLKGREKLFGFFVGEVMKLTKGKANPKIVNELLKERLTSQKMT